MYHIGVSNGNPVFNTSPQQPAVMAITNSPSLPSMLPLSHPQAAVPNMALMSQHHMQVSMLILSVHNNLCLVMELFSLYSTELYNYFHLYLHWECLNVVILIFSIELLLAINCKLSTYLLLLAIFQNTSQILSPEKLFRTRSLIGRLFCRLLPLTTLITQTTYSRLSESAC